MTRAGTIFLGLSLGLLTLAAALFFVYSSGWAWAVFAGGVIFLMLALGDEPFSPPDLADELDAMPLVSDDLGEITIAGGVLAISDSWNLSDGLRLEGVPKELHVRVRLRGQDEVQALVALELSGEPTSDESASDNISADSIPVDSGFVYFGDAALFDHGIRPRNLKKLIETAFEEPGPMRVLVTDPGGTHRGVVCQSGLGAGLYKVEWVSAGTWRLRCGFVS